MTEESLSPSSSGGGPGMSRAAKKRAKKKQKRDHVVASIPAVSQQEQPTKSTSSSIDDDIKQKHPKKKEATHKRVDFEEDNVQDAQIKQQGVHNDTLPPEFTNLLQVVNSESHMAADRARFALAFLLQMPSLDDFYKSYWEKQPLFVKAKDGRSRLNGLLSLSSIRKLTKEQQSSLQYGQDLNVTRYQLVDGVKRRMTLDVLNKDGTGAAINVDHLWKQFEKEHCTIRLLCPHKHVPPIHALLSLLELEFGCMVGANAYLTPGDSSQGFAPHYDDIEAFVLQLEGQKRWKVYAPRGNEKLARYSSKDFTEEELRDAKLVMDVVLEPGDVLYMPRGWIHQACTTNKEHSLHLTVSAMQQWAWVDLMEMLLPEAIEAAASDDEDVSLRSGLPRCFLEYMGCVHDNDPNKLPDVLKKKEFEEDDEDGKNDEAKAIEELRERFRIETKKKIATVAEHAMEMLDAVCDQMGKRFLSDRLPPSLTAQEAKSTSRGDDGRDDVKILPNMLCRLVRPGVARLAIEDNKAVLYHSMDNSCVYHEHALSPMEFELDDAPAIEQLLTTVEPRWVAVEDLIHDTMDDKVGVAQALYDEGILSIRE